MLKKLKFHRIQIIHKVQITFGPTLCHSAFDVLAKFGAGKPVRGEICDRFRSMM